MLRKNQKIVILCAGLLILTALSANQLLNSSWSGAPQLKKVTGIFQKNAQPEQVFMEDQSSEEMFPEDMNEFAVQSAIHHMSHQKIKADQKWGSLQITPERINRLLYVVKNNEDQYENAYLYMEILESWSENDFSEADTDHNAVWKLQGGSVGEAVGILSPEEEAKYVQKNFK